MVPLQKFLSAPILHSMSVQVSSELYHAVSSLSFTFRDSCFWRHFELQANGLLGYTNKWSRWYNQVWLIKWRLSNWRLDRAEKCIMYLFSSFRIRKCCWGQSLCPLWNLYLHWRQWRMRNFNLPCVRWWQKTKTCRCQNHYGKSLWYFWDLDQFWSFQMKTKSADGVHVVVKDAFISEDPETGVKLVSS